MRVNLRLKHMETVGFMTVTNMATRPYKKELHSKNKKNQLIPAHSKGKTTPENED